MELSKTQIDKLGERLKSGKPTESDLRLLDEYRLSFAECHETVIAKLRDDLGLEPTGRPSKTTPSIVDKLRRESIRLSQIQDIAGCRLIVRDIQAQEHIVLRAASLFDEVRIVDRREKPSHGYRAVHIVVKCDGRLIEIQVRTEFQQVWAELCEKFADKHGQPIKYGKGNPTVVQVLFAASRLGRLVEFTEVRIDEIVSGLARIDMAPPERQKRVDEQRAHVMQLREEIVSIRVEIIDGFRNLLPGIGSY